MHEYILRYLPQFREDLKNAVLYISDELLNPQAAADLIDAAEKAILERIPTAEALNSITHATIINTRIIGYM